MKIIKLKSVSVLFKIFISRKKCRTFLSLSFTNVFIKTLYSFFYYFFDASVYGINENNILETHVFCNFVCKTSVEKNKWKISRKIIKNIFACYAENNILLARIFLYQTLQKRKIARNHNCTVHTF